MPTEIHIQEGIDIQLTYTEVLVLRQALETFAAMPSTPIADRGDAIKLERWLKDSTRGVWLLLPDD